MFPAWRQFLIALVVICGIMASFDQHHLGPLLNYTEIALISLDASLFLQAFDVLSISYVELAQ